MREKLGFVHRQNRFSGFDLDNYLILDKQIKPVTQFQAHIIVNQWQG